MLQSAFNSQALLRIYARCLTIRSKSMARKWPEATQCSQWKCQCILQKDNTALFDRTCLTDMAYFFNPSSRSAPFQNFSCVISWEFFADSLDTQTFLSKSDPFRILDAWEKWVNTCWNSFFLLEDDYRMNCWLIFISQPLNISPTFWYQLNQASE